MANPSSWDLLNTIATNTGTAPPPSSSALSVLGTFEIPYSDIAQYGAGWYEITSGFGSNVQLVLCADTCGQTMQIGINYPSVSVLFLTNPGCEREYPVLIGSGTPISIQSNNANAPTSGTYVITFLG